MIITLMIYLIWQFRYIPRGKLSGIVGNKKAPY